MHMIGHSMPRAYDFLSFVATQVERRLGQPGLFKLSEGAHIRRPALSTPRGSFGDASVLIEDAQAGQSHSEPTEEATGLGQNHATGKPISGTRHTLSARARRQRSALGVRGVKPEHASEPRARMKDEEIEVTHTEHVASIPPCDEVVPVASGLDARSAAREAEGWAQRRSAQPREAIRLP